MFICELSVLSQWMEWTLSARKSACTCVFIYACKLCIQRYCCECRPDTNVPTDMQISLCGCVNMLVKNECEFPCMSIYLFASVSVCTWVTHAYSFYAGILWERLVSQLVPFRNDVNIRQQCLQVCSFDRDIQHKQRHQIHNDVLTLVFSLRAAKTRGDRTKEKTYLLVFKIFNFTIS